MQHLKEVDTGLFTIGTVVFIADVSRLRSHLVAITESIQTKKNTGIAASTGVSAKTGHDPLTMAAAQSPRSTSEPSYASPSHSTSTSRKRKRSGEYGFMRDTGEHDSARFVGSSSGIHFIRNVHLRLSKRSANRSQANGTNSEARALGELVPGEDDQLRQRTSQRDGETANLWKDHETLEDDTSKPTFDQLVAWSKSYFQAWHPILPFLHGPDILRIFEDVSQNGVASLEHHDRAILRSVLSISVADSRQGTSLGEPVPVSHLFRSVDEAVSCSQFALGQPASIRATQAALSIQIFLISMLCLNAASRLGGLIVRMAFHLGLHRCPTRYPFFSPEEAARRRRVFWCLYCCERFLSQSLGLPLDIRDDDIDVCYPGEELHGIASREDQNDKRLRLLNFMSKHARIRGLILELRNKSLPARQDTADRAMAVQTELAKWSNEIQDAVEEAELMEDSDDPSEPQLSSGHRLVLLMSKYESTISLNRPMMASDPSSPLWSAAMQACISAAKSICITMKRHSTQNRKPDDSNGRNLEVPMLWPAFIWATWISAFVLAYAAFEQQMPLESALRHIESSKEALRHISTRETSWPEYCVSAIDDLTSAVKELLQAPEASRSQGPNGETLRNRTLRTTRSQAQPTASTSSNRDASVAQDEEPQMFTPVVVSSAGLGQGPIGQAVYDDPFQPPRSQWARGNSGYSTPLRQSYQPSNMPPPNWDGQLAPGLGNGQFPATSQYDVTDSSAFGGSGEGQESMMWYDQLFDSSFSALDNPFLAAAQFDPSIDPTWSYLK